MRVRLWSTAATVIAVAIVGATMVPAAQRIFDPKHPEEQLLDESNGRDWPGFNRTYGEQRYSPLSQISAANIKALGLAWSMDLEQGSSVTAPIAVDGVLYFASKYSVIHAVDAVSGKLLWQYDPKAPEAAGRKLRQGWGSRGLAWWNGKIYAGTHDGRLIAVDAKTGKLLWSAMTIRKHDARYITSAPRVFGGKVIIGHAGADIGAVRGYVTTYDAETGKQLWRFYTVPGQPGVDDDETTRIAAKTWAGEWWKYGGGGTVWNAITYDAESDTILLGTGNGAPWNHKIRSQGKGDNLFLCSLVALDAKTGKYKWHYQFNPGETWDYNSVMDVQLAELTIDGQQRKVAMTAPKNGFFYVIDRTNGKLISAEPFVEVNWASKIDIKTGRPIENPGVRFEGGRTVVIKPGAQGGHNWPPMSFNPRTGLVYIPTVNMASSYDDKGINLKTWKASPGMIVNNGVHVNFAKEVSSALIAWDPVRQKEIWRQPSPGYYSSGTLATAGGLVFQGRVSGEFNAYDATSGRPLWSFNAQAPVSAPPISFEANGRQYVTVLTGLGGGGALFADRMPVRSDYRTMARRVLTFAIGGTKKLPKSEPVKPTAFDDPDYRPEAVIADGSPDAFGGLFGRHCVMCHGIGAVAGGMAPDLRTSDIVLTQEAFAEVVRGGALVPNGMPRFEEFSDAELKELRQYIRSRAAELRAETGP